MNDAKKEWTKAEVEELINAFRSSPELWDSNHENYKNQVVKHQRIKEFSILFSTTPEEISRKLHNLRTQFNGQLKKMYNKKLESGANDIYTSPWPYFSAMYFLHENKLARQINGDSEMGEETYYIKPDLGESSEDAETTLTYSVPEIINDEIEENSMNTYGTMRRLRKRKPQVQNLIQAAKALNKKDDQYEVFGTYIASELRSKKSEYLRLKLKRKIQQALVEINEEEEEMLRKDIYPTSSN